MKFPVGSILVMFGVLLAGAAPNTRRHIERVAVADAAIVRADFDPVPPVSAGPLLADNSPLDAGYTQPTSGGQAQPTVQQVSAAVKTSYDAIEGGDYWPLLFVIPFAVMGGLTLLWRKYPADWSKVMAHPVTVVIAGSMTTAIGMIGHAVACGHPLDKTLAIHCAEIVGSALFVWYQKQSAPMATPTSVPVQSPTLNIAK